MSREKIEKIMDTFDLGFSDFYKDENVRQLTFQKKLDKLEQVTELMTTEEYVNYSIFNRRGAKHPTAEIYAIDFPSDLRASVYLLLGGYYRQAILCLRNWLEIRLTGIYFGFVNPDTGQYEDWKNGRKRAPIVQGLAKKLFCRAEFQKIDGSCDLRNRLRESLAELSAFTHGSMLEKYDLTSQTDNVPRFNPQAVDLWFDFASRTFAELIFCYMVAYGKDGFRMGQGEFEIIRHHLPEAYKREFQKRGIL